MTAKQGIPDIVIGRLPLYLRTLQRMAQEGHEVTSSQELGEILGISAAQIRKDLSQFGEFGKQGTGYHIPFLTDQLLRILKLEKVWGVAIIGSGDVGTALANYQGFLDRGFKVALIFDNDPDKIGTTIGSFEVQNAMDMVTKIQEAGIKVAMLAVPADHAQTATDQLIKAGVKAILNYAPIRLSAPPEIRIEHIDPAVHLQRMTYYLE
jgi:redox-sensing transcriptional repressor